MENNLSYSPLFSGEGDFCWATGIEDTFIPQARPGLRALDEYELTQHYQEWNGDLALAASLGVRAVRWGIPWYRVQPELARYDWEWTDQVIETMVDEHNLVLILDLMHYGTPLWLDNSFINAHYPERVAEYAAAVARRYKGRVQVYTPLNEPVVNADFCGRRGEWPPYLSGEDGFVKVLVAIAKGMVLTAEALRAELPEAVLVQVEALWQFHTQAEAYQSQVAAGNARQYLAYDLATGRVDENYPLLDYLLSHGVTENELADFQQRLAHFDVFGANFYPWSYGERAPGPDGGLELVEGRTPGSAIAELLEAVLHRYGLPVMVTETSARGDLSERRRWMDETLAAVWRLREQGQPVMGYTWFPMMTMVDWAYRREEKPLRNYLLHLGLFDSAFDDEGRLVRRPTDLVEHYRSYVENPVPLLKE